MSKMYISCETLNTLFDDYEKEGRNPWIITDCIEDLCQALADTNLLLIDSGDEGEQEKLRFINYAIIGALRYLKPLKKEVEEIIENGEVLQQGGEKRKGGAT